MIFIFCQSKSDITIFWWFFWIYLLKILTCMKNLSIVQCVHYIIVNTSKLDSNLNIKRVLDSQWCFYPALLWVAKHLRGSVVTVSPYLLSVKQSYLAPGDTMCRCDLKVTWAGTDSTQRSPSINSPASHWALKRP